MSTINLDRRLIREHYDLRGRADSDRYIAYEQDLNPAFHRLRASGPVHEGTMHALIGYSGSEPFFQGLPEHDRPHFTVFSYDECMTVYRNPEVFASWPSDVPRPTSGTMASILTMDGAEHRRYRTLVQGAFLPGKSHWWVENWIERIVHALIDNFEGDGRADLNIDFDAAIPLLTMIGSFGLSMGQAFEVRNDVEDARVTTGVLAGFLAPIIAARRAKPADDLITVLCHAEITEEDGSTHRLTDQEIITFAYVLLAAGTGTTWKQMGITLIALLSNPEVLESVRADGSLLHPTVIESLRWNATDPAFARWAIQDTSLAGVRIPAGAVVHLCIGAANRDPARWTDPDVFDIHRRLLPSLGFANGPHVCLGQHLARAEMVTAIGALLDRLSNLRLDPDADAPKIIGLYERGPTHIPVVWD